jgi:hypothetical protein
MLLVVAAAILAPFVWLGLGRYVVERQLDQLHPRRRTRGEVWGFRLLVLPGALLFLAIGVLLLTEPAAWTGNDATPLCDDAVSRSGYPDYCP